jgi:hypothetical protein
MSLLRGSTYSAQRDRHRGGSWLAGLLFTVWWAATLGVFFRVSPPGDVIPGWLVVGLLLVATASSLAAGKSRLLKGSLYEHLGAVLAIGWVLLTLTVLLSFPVVDSIFGALALYGLLVLVALGIIGIGLFRFGSNRGDSAAGIAVAITAGAVFALTLVPIIHTGISIRTRLVESRYESELAMIIASEDPLSFEGPSRMIDPGPPLRVLWVWWYGVLDNLGGIVSDPSKSADQLGAVLTDDQGMISTCTHLYDSWYYCAFN